VINVSGITQLEGESVYLNTDDLRHDQWVERSELAMVLDPEVTMRET